MALPSNENWQAGKNVLGCNEYMFINQLYCDVTFKVGTAGKDVKAHKYVLASRSSVFAAMLYGSLSETSDVIVISDIEPMVFDTLLRFMYFEAREINEYNVIGTLYAAEKYDVMDLVEICRSYLESNIAEGTVCVIMENARMFNMAELFTKCMKFIFRCNDSTKTVFVSPGFLDLRRECLKALVESDDLTLDETCIYQSLIRWARHNCKKDNTCNSDSNHLRKMLGDILYEIRFPTMSLENFWKTIVLDDILLNDEKVQISEQILGKCVKNPVFKTSQRKKSYLIKTEILRILSDPESCGWDQTCNIDAIDFKVNKGMALVGILLYGNSGSSYTYDIEVKIISNANVDLIHLSPEKIKETEKLFRINFDKPIQINPDQIYTVWVKLDGPMSYVGQYTDSVNHEDYVFNFSDSRYCKNGTNVRVGQIPGLLCSFR